MCECVCVYICRFSYRSVLLPAVIGQLSGFFFKRFRGERGAREGGRIGWLENRFCRRVVAILLPFPLQRTDSFIFESAKIPSRIPSSNFQRVFEAQSRRVNENGWVTLSSKKSCSSREPSELFFITVSFSLLHNADRTSFVRYSMVYIYIRIRLSANCFVSSKTVSYF